MKTQQNPFFDFPSLHRPINIARCSADMEGTFGGFLEQWSVFVNQRTYPSITDPENIFCVSGLKEVLQRVELLNCLSIQLQQNPDFQPTDVIQDIHDFLLVRCMPFNKGETQGLIKQFFDHLESKDLGHWEKVSVYTFWQHLSHHSPAVKYWLEVHMDRSMIFHNEFQSIPAWNIYNYITQKTPSNCKIYDHVSLLKRINEVIPTKIESMLRGLFEKTLNLNDEDEIILYRLVVSSYCLNNVVRDCVNRVMRQNYTLP